MRNSIIVLILLTAMSMTPSKKKRIVFFGDSITEAGVNKGGYIDRIQHWMDEKQLDKEYELIGAGIGGNKVYDLYLRMEEDVLKKKPDIVFVYVGINDVWHKSTMGTGTDIDKFDKFYSALIGKLQAQHIKVFLCTPSVIGEKKAGANPQDKDLDAFSKVIRQLATTHHCTLVDLRRSFLDYEETHNTDNKESGILTTDFVHLNSEGNQLVAEQMCKALINSKA